MVRADLMDGIDQMLRLNRARPREPFGGVQMVFFGDVFQLEPVVASDEEGIFFSSEYRSPFFFDAKVFNMAEFQIIDLQKVFRQKDKDFIVLLDAIRMHSFGHSHLRMINHFRILHLQAPMRLRTRSMIAVWLNFPNPSLYILASWRATFLNDLFQRVWCSISVREHRSCL